MDSHVWTEFIEVSVAILLHFVRCEDGQGPVGVHGDHHTANVCLEEEEEEEETVSEKPRGIYSVLCRTLFIASLHLGDNC